MSAIILENDIIHYEVLGRGRPVIFLHGWVGSWHYWIPTMQATSVAFRAYALDLYGFGDTAKNNERYSLEAQVGLIDEFLEEMGMGKVALIGHGLGAVVALLFAAKHPSLVDRVMAVSYPLEPQTLSPRLATSAPEELGDWLLGRTPGAHATRLETPKTDTRAILASLRGLQEPHSNSGSPWPAPATTPCLLVHGQNDPLYPIPRPELLATLPEHIHQITFEEAGHFPMLDEANIFSRLVFDFLALGSGESPRQLQLKEEWKRRVR